MLRSVMLPVIIILAFFHVLTSNLASALSLQTKPALTLEPKSVPRRDYPTPNCNMLGNYSKDHNEIDCGDPSAVTLGNPGIQVCKNG